MIYALAEIGSHILEIMSDTCRAYTFYTANMSLTIKAPLSGRWDMGHGVRDRRGVAYCLKRILDMFRVCSGLPAVSAYAHLNGHVLALRTSNVFAISSQPHWTWNQPAHISFIGHESMSYTNRIYKLYWEYYASRMLFNMGYESSLLMVVYMAHIIDFIRSLFMG